MKYWVTLGLLLVSTVTCAGVRVQVEGHGETEKEAERDGWRVACEQVIGQVIVSDQEVKHDQLTKDSIGNYSSCRTDASETLEKRKDEFGYSLKMNVTVSDSKIAQRMMYKGEQSQLIHGNQIQIQIESEVEQRVQGDQLLSQVLNSYPEHAFLVTAGQTEYKISNRRAPYIEIPIEIRMSSTWLTALSDTLNSVAKKSFSCNIWSRMLVSNIANKKITDRMDCGQIPDLRVGDNYYYFYDQETLKILNAELQPTVGYQRIAIYIDIEDAGGGTLDHTCVDVNTATFIKYNDPPGVVNNNTRDLILRPEIVNEKTIVTNLHINLANIRDFGEASKIKLTVGKTCQ
jgi:hypothetical protein